MLFRQEDVGLKMVIFDGTNYSANSFFASVEKKINEKHSLNFTSVFAQNKRGKNSPNTDEVTGLTSEKI